MTAMGIGMGWLAQDQRRVCRSKVLSTLADRMRKKLRSGEVSMRTSKLVLELPMGLSLTLKSWVGWLCL